MARQITVRLIPIVLIALVSPIGASYSSTSFTPNYAEYIRPGVIAQHWLSSREVDFALEIPYDRSVNSMEAEMLTDFSVKSGVLLGSGFRSNIHSYLHVKGQLQCFSGVGSQWGAASGSLYRSVRLWDRSTGSLVREWPFGGNIGCAGTTLPLTYDGGYNLTTTGIDFLAGHDYAIGVFVRLLGSTTDKGSFVADFYDDGDGRNVDIGAVTIATPKPVAKIFPASEWYPYNLAFGSGVHGQACDYLGLNYATISVIGGTAYPSEVFLAPGADEGCIDHTFRPRFATPGTYYSEIFAKTPEAETSASSTVEITLFPASGSSLEADPHLPDLGQISSTAIDPIVLEVSARLDGTPVGGRLLQGGVVISDTTPLSTTSDSAHQFQMTYVPTTKFVTAEVGGNVVWTGQVEQYGANWWELRPLPSQNMTLQPGN